MASEEKDEYISRKRMGMQRLWQIKINNSIIVSQGITTTSEIKGIQTVQNEFFTNQTIVANKIFILAVERQKYFCEKRRKLNSLCFEWSVDSETRVLILKFCLRFCYKDSR